MGEVPAGEGEENRVFPCYGFILSQYIAIFSRNQVPRRKNSDFFIKFLVAP